MEQPTQLAAEAPDGGDRPVVVLPVLAFLSLVGGQLPSFSTRANLFAISLGGTMLTLGLARRPARTPARLGSGTVWWLVPLAIFAVFEGSTYLLGSTADYPTFSKLTDPLLEDELLRTAGYFAWLTGFWALARR
jgi:hypothetical protein